MVSTCRPAKHLGQSLEHLGVRQRLHELGLEPSDEPAEDVGGPVWGPTRRSRLGPAPRLSPGCLGRDPTTHTASPTSIPRVSGPASVGHRARGAGQGSTPHDTGRRFLYPTRPHPHPVWGQPRLPAGPSHTGRAASPTRRKGQGGLRASGEQEGGRRRRPGGREDQEEAPSAPAGCPADGPPRGSLLGALTRD